MKKLLSFGLCLALLLASSLSVQAPEPKPEMAAECVIAVLVIVIGGVCIIGIVKCCKLLNKLDPPDPPTNTIPIIPTNNVPTNNPAWTNPPVANFPMALLTTNSIITIQQSLGLKDWADITTVTITNMGAGQIVLASGTLCLTSSIVNGQALFFLPPVAQAPSDSKFFRLISTP